jgi:hypothetical protein
MKKMHAALEKLRSAFAEFEAAIAETELPLQIEKNVPTTRTAQRIATLFNRRLTTPWSVPEIKAFRALGVIADADLELVERYYASERAKGETNGRHRRDLCTFLNNYSGELDRARAFSQTTPKGWAQDSTLKAKEL